MAMHVEEGDRNSSSGGEDDSRGLSQSLQSTGTFLSTYLPGSCQVDTLVLVFHGGSAIETSGEVSIKSIDCQTMQSTIDQIVKTHYRFAKGRVAVRLVACPPVCKSAVDLLSRISPNAEFGKQSSIHAGATQLPLESLAIFAMSQPEYQEIIVSVIVKANEVFEGFLQSSEGQDFAGNVSLRVYVDMWCLSQYPQEPVNLSGLVHSSVQLSFMHMHPKCSLSVCLPA